MQVAHVLRFSPMFVAIHDLAHAGLPGHIFSLEGDYVHNLINQTDKTDPQAGRNRNLEQEWHMVGGGGHSVDVPVLRP